MDYLEYKGYKGSVEYSKEDNCLFGKVQGLRRNLITYEGDSIDELRQDFQAGIDDYLAACEAEGIKPEKRFNGKIYIRMSSELHSRIAALATSTGRSINEFITQAVKNEIAKENMVFS